MYQYKVKGSETKPNPLCLDNVSNDSTLNNMKKTGLKESVKVFLLIILLLILAMS